MKLYLAPLEGITTYVYRNAFSEIFAGCVDKYFAPFLMPHIKRDMNFKEKKDLIPEHNQGLYLVPQLLTDSVEDFLRYEKILSDMGYLEINLNLGCPSGTVTAKGRGAGFLGRRQELDHFLEEVFSSNIGKISLKTRIGIEDTEEFYALLEIYNKYPLEELIIHPRLLKEQYKGKPHQEMFLYALEKSKNPLVYNGDIWEKEDLSRLQEKTGEKNFDLMLGRGAIANPALFRQLRGGKAISQKELSDLLEKVEREYKNMLSGDTQVLFRLKELWTWLIRLFPGREKELKKLLKCKNLEEFCFLQEKLIGELAQEF